MKTSNISFPMLAFAALILCFSFLPAATASAGVKTQVGILYTTEQKWQPEGKFKITFKASNCPAQAKYPPKKARKHKLNCYKFK